MTTSPGIVTAVVCAVFDEVADREVRRRIDLLGAAGARVRDPLPHPPHLTLAAARVTGSALPPVLDLLPRVAAVHEPFDLALTHLGCFPAGGVLWLAPEPSSALSRLQSDTDAALRAAGYDRAFGDRSEPARWVAHCTLASRLSAQALGAAVSLSANGFRPIRARVEAVVTVLVGEPGELGRVALGRSNACSGSTVRG